ncbi:FxLYD domain-containing protein [Natronolimnohabitans sp. A-GB9]|uniref:FxLYD domain-containing protein n=1 Tax=Natronolimnohabitans sp. A-GB9 TaxID=3069757 RepID=UPI0027B0B284|nr:FxLYD domain-containing protein [Natronolimnohabitans sp. A-GB9]MDQ2052884.1 FxLYD domain-containing protein [Natronolimnohabitans sp. A-GB9]
MNRRKFILGSGAVLTTTLAGCSGDESDYEEGNGGDNGNDENGGDNGDDAEPTEDDIVITEHEMIIEEGDFMDDITVEGVVENNGEEMANYLEVTARVYDEDGNQLDSYIDNTNDLDAGGSWAFEIMVLEDAEDVDDYDIAVEDITW